MKIESFSKALGIYIFLSGLVGLFYWKSLKQNHWKFFVIYLLIIGSMEIIDGNFVPRSVNQKIILYFIIPFEFLSAYYLFFKELTTAWGKKLVLISTVVYLCTFLIEILYLNDPKVIYFFGLSYLVGNVFLVLLILSYFWSLTTSDKILNFTNEQMFWVSFGFLVFWLGSLPYYGLFTYLYHNFKPVFDIYSIVALVLNYTMYSLFIFSFIWTKKN